MHYNPALKRFYMFYCAFYFFPTVDHIYSQVFIILLSHLTMEISYSNWYVEVVCSVSYYK